MAAEQPAGRTGARLPNEIIPRKHPAISRVNSATGLPSRPAVLRRSHRYRAAVAPPADHNLIPNTLLFHPTSDNSTYLTSNESVHRPLERIIQTRVDNDDITLVIPLAMCPTYRIE